MSFIHRILAAILGLLTLPLRMLGLGPSPSSAQALAVEALADDGPAPVDDAVAFPFGTLIREHAARRLSPPAPGTPALAPLPHLVEAWMARLTRAQLFAIRRTPPRLLEQHATSGEEGRCRHELGIVTPAAVLSLPIQPRTEQAAGGRAASGGDQRFEMEPPEGDDPAWIVEAADEVIASLQINRR